MKDSIKTLYLLILLSFFTSAATCQSQITLPSFFCDNMVLQQNMDAPIWGWAEPDTKITVIREVGILQTLYRVLPIKMANGW